MHIKRSERARTHCGGTAAHGPPRRLRRHVDAALHLRHLADHLLCQGRGGGGGGLLPAAVGVSEHEVEYPQQLAGLDELRQWRRTTENLGMAVYL